MINMKDIKKLDTVEIENKIKDLKESLLKAKINKLNQGDFDTNSFKKIKKDIARCMTEVNLRGKE